MVKKVLVTGGAGYIGTILVPMLLEKGYSVRVLDNLTYGGDGLIQNFHNKNFEFLQGDVRNWNDIKNALDGVDIIIHLAAIVGLPACKLFPELSEEINVTGTKNLLAFRKPEQIIIFASTISNYGDVAMPGQICKEETELRPNTNYSFQKTKAEKLVKEAGNFIIFRFATAYGMSPRMRIDLLPNDFVYRAIKEKQIIVYEKDVKRPFAHVRDISRGIVFALENTDKMINQVFNLGSEESNVTKGDIVNLIKLKCPDFILHFTDHGAQDDRRNFHVDYSKIQALGFNTLISLKDGIDELVRGMQAVEFRHKYANV